MNAKSKSKLLNNILFWGTFFLVIALGLKFEIGKKLPTNEIVYAIGGLVVGGYIRIIYLYRQTRGNAHPPKKQKLISWCLLLAGLLAGLLMAMSGLFPSVLENN